MKTWNGWGTMLMLMMGGFLEADEPNDRMLFNFRESGGREAWEAVNDGVMGGRSRGGAELGEGTMQFSGTLSLENNGGFSSIRNPGAWDLSEYAGVRLRVRGDGRTYQLRLQTDARYRRWLVSFSGEFETRKGEWIEVEVPFSSLRASFRGRDLSGYAFDPETIQLFGLLLADKQGGPFALEVQWIEAYRNPSGA